MTNAWPDDLAGYVNFRDLGGHPTPRGTTRFGRVFRSDSLAHAGDEHVEHLVTERGVRTVVDLRGEQEVDAFPNRPMRDAGVAIHHVPLIDPAKRGSAGVDWDTITIVDLYLFMLRTSGERFVEALRIIADPGNHPLVFHCAAGKDRAGLIAATVLGLVGVDDEEIIADYAQTAAALDSLVVRAQARAAVTGRPPHDRFMTAEAATLREVIGWLRAEYGGFEEYVLAHGLEPREIESLNAALVEPAR